MTATMQADDADDAHKAEQQLSETFAALANTTRRAMLARLSSGPATVGELAEPFAMSLPAVSKHIRVLERCGLIVQGQSAQYRPCTIDAAPLAAVSGWAEQYRTLWESRFDQLDGYLESLESSQHATSEDSTHQHSTSEGTTQ